MWSLREHLIQAGGREQSWVGKVAGAVLHTISWQEQPLNEHLPCAICPLDSRRTCEPVVQTCCTGEETEAGESGGKWRTHGLGFPDTSVGKESTYNAGDPGSISGLGRFAGEGIGHPLQYSWTYLVTQLVKNLPTMQEKGYLLQYSGLENCMNCIVHGVAKSWIWLSGFHFMDCSTPGFIALHHLLEFAQTHVHCIGDAVQPSHLLSPPSPHALSLSQHHGLFQWVSSLHQVVRVLSALASWVLWLGQWRTVAFQVSAISLKISDICWDWAIDRFFWKWMNQVWSGRVMSFEYHSTAGFRKTWEEDRTCIWRSVSASFSILYLYPSPGPLRSITSFSPVKLNHPSQPISFWLTHPKTYPCSSVYGDPMAYSCLVISTDF